MIAIKVNNLTKIYKIYQSPMQRLKEIILRKPLHREFFALNNINFTVLQGETFGIIGENGVGKSTLLKLLAKTLKPTSGEMSINGQVAALLELGAGFDPELTGEENIYLNAYLMGLSREDIERNRNEIINFSELGDFIKRPVKTYSTGMYLRLAFSISICVNPDILIVDEALSVGDQHFQKKCIDRIIEFKEKGKTILFCSHFMYHVKQICNKVLWLKDGIVAACGDTNNVVDQYLDYTRAKDSVLTSRNNTSYAASGESKDKDWFNTLESPVKQQKDTFIKDVIFTDMNGNSKNVFKTGDSLEVKIYCQVQQPEKKVVVGIVIVRNDKITCYGGSTLIDGVDLKRVEQNVCFIGLRFPNIPLLSGKYYVNIVLFDANGVHVYDRAVRIFSFLVRHDTAELGVFYLDHQWFTD